MGGHIGGFTCWALGQGATFVVPVEPEPENLRLLRRNTEFATDRVRVVEGAAVEEAGPVTFYRPAGKSFGVGSLVTRGRKQPLTVTGVAFDDLLDSVRPRVVKVDIEGGEYALSALTRLPPFVEALTMEVHTKTKAMHRAAPALVAAIEAQGFRPSARPRFTPKGWAACGTWHRPAAGTD